MQPLEADDGPRKPIERLVRPFQVFAQNKVAGAIVLVAAAAIAMVWANSPWADSYKRLLATPFGVGVGDAALVKPLILWINDGLMAIFFFLVGLEIKREVLAGELATVRKATLPIAGAIGGMLVPAGIYAAFNVGGPGANGWGIPMATDIAFALGVLLLVGSRAPIGLKVFLTALAIVDDIGAIVVIAVFYTDTISLTIIGIGGGLIVFSMIGNMMGIRDSVFYFVVGALAWFAFLKSGVHATLAAVLMAFTIPARSRIDGGSLVRQLEQLIQRLRKEGFSEGQRLLTVEQEHILHTMERKLELGTAPLQKLEHAVVPIATFIVMPVFALANAGIVMSGSFGDAVSNPVFLGIVGGLFVGKQIGVFLFAWLAVKLGIADLPTGVTWRQIHAVGILAGIGFTMSLFVNSLAFNDPGTAETAKLAIVSASAISAVIGGLLLTSATKAAPATVDS